MFTLALVARYVDEQLGRRAEIARAGRKFTKPVVVPEGGTEVEVEGSLAWTTATIALTRHLRR